MFNIGIIGCGKIAQVRHIPEYMDHPQANLAGLFDLNQERARELAQKYGARAYSSWEEMLADPAIDAVSVCVANNAHAEISIAALKAGKHVLCEKPMATTLADCEAMVAAARESGKFLMIGQNQRLTRAHQKARELVEQGALERYELALSGEHLLEVTRKGANKGEMVRKLAALCGVGEDHIYCVGDHANDLPMLHAAAGAFAPSNAIDQVREDPRVTVVGHCQDGAIADVIALLEARYRRA